MCEEEPLVKELATCSFFPFHPSPLIIFFSSSPIIVRTDHLLHIPPRQSNMLNHLGTENWLPRLLCWHTPCLPLSPQPFFRCNNPPPYFPNPLIIQFLFSELFPIFLYVGEDVKTKTTRPFLTGSMRCQSSQGWLPSSRRNQSQPEQVLHKQTSEQAWHLALCTISPHLPSRWLFHVER